MFDCHIGSAILACRLFGCNFSLYFLDIKPNAFLTSYVCCVVLSFCPSVVVSFTLAALFPSFFTVFFSKCYFPLTPPVIFRLVGWLVRRGREVTLPCYNRSN